MSDMSVFPLRIVKRTTVREPSIDDGWEAAITAIARTGSHIANLKKVRAEAREGVVDGVKIPDCKEVGYPGQDLNSDFNGHARKAVETVKLASRIRWPDTPALPKNLSPVEDLHQGAAKLQEIFYVLPTMLFSKNHWIFGKTVNGPSADAARIAQHCLQDNFIKKLETLKADISDGHRGSIKKYAALCQKSSKDIEQIVPGSHLDTLDFYGNFQDRLKDIKIVHSKLQELGETLALAEAMPIHTDREAQNIGRLFDEVGINLVKVDAWKKTVEDEPFHASDYETL